MRGARYVRLISWTLQSGSEHLRCPEYRRKNYVISDFSGRTHFFMCGKMAANLFLRLCKIN